MKIKEGYKTRNIAGECIVVAIGTLHVNLTKIITLNPTSQWLWNELQGKDFTPETVAGMLADRYEVDAATALTDSRTWIGQLQQAGLIED